MAQVFLGSTIKELRTRKKWQQEKFLSMLYKYEPNIYRLEFGELIPEPDHLQNIMDVLEAPMDEMLCPHLDNQPMEVYSLRYRLHQALDDKDVRQAQKLFDEIDSKMDHDGPVNRQFVLSQKARLMELQGVDATDILPLVIEGLNETYKSFNERSPGSDVLLFEEPDLFHTMARLYARLDRLQDGIRILKQTYHGLQKLSIGERERDRRAVPILLTLAASLMQAGEHEEVINVCDVGFDTSALRCLGKGMPEFLWYKAEALLKLDISTKVDHMLRMAYAGFVLAGEKGKAETMLANIHSSYGVAVDTFGMEKADVPAVNKVPYARGVPPVCESIGEMIRLLRKKVKLSLAILSQGICSPQNLGKIETGDIRGKMFYIEPILQRLGRDPSLYCNFFLLKEDFEAVETRDMIHLLFINQRYEQAAELLGKLKAYKSFEDRANLQFVRYAELTLQEKLHGTLEASEKEKKLLEILHMTCPNFDEDLIKHYPLTHRETILLNKLANHYMRLKNYSRAAKIFEALITNLDWRCVDEYEKARMYATVMLNYSSCLGRSGRNREACSIAEKAYEFDQSRGRLSLLPNLIFNKAYTIFMEGNKELSFPYIVLSYYGFCLFEDYGEANNIGISHKFVRENFDVSLMR